FPSGIDNCWAHASSIRTPRLEVGRSRYNARAGCQFVGFLRCVEAMMNVKYLKTLVLATAVGAGALAYSGPADAYVRGCGWRPHYWHHAWHSGCRSPVVASDYDVVVPRRSCHSGCVAAAPIVAAPVIATPAGYGGWGGY